ncbi:hypothetical protein HAX54_009014 [Datura stramonium]|uniref:Uncharacterized protein n=1 Tax=Datura stramonium TaxID=4076 RepID=A0ABS8TFK4_DATST|nr:hypothetical protein [Datura stramonium]
MEASSRENSGKRGGTCGSGGRRSSERNKESETCLLGRRKVEERRGERVKGEVGDVGQRRGSRWTETDEAGVVLGFVDRRRGRNRKYGRPPFDQPSTAMGCSGYF